MPSGRIAQRDNTALPGTLTTDLSASVDGEAPIMSASLMDEHLKRNGTLSSCSQTSYPMLCFLTGLILTLQTILGRGRERQFRTTSEMRCRSSMPLDVLR